jgi:hypothetical protein
MIYDGPFRVLGTRTAFVLPAKNTNPRGGDEQQQNEILTFLHASMKSNF